MADAPTPNTPPPPGAADAASAAATSASTYQPKSALDRFLAWCLRHWLLTGITLLIGSCAFMTRDRTVTWEEEVPLNTGETIWVTRSEKFVLKGAGGNPMDLAIRPERKNEHISFTYQNRKFEYSGAAHILLLGISPSGIPALVAPAADRGWDQLNNYYCASPHYVQLVPGPNGSSWAWPEQIETWLYGQRTNLMLNRDISILNKGRVTSEDRAAADSSISSGHPSFKAINPAYLPNYCKKRN